MSGSGEGHRPLPAGRHDDAPLIQAPLAEKQAANPVTKSADENVTRGGKRTGAGRKVLHASPAEKQRAYRQRKKAT